MRSVITFVILFSIAFTTTGQEEDCEITLARATEEFQAGHFYAVAGILDKCSGKFSTEQSQRAHLLLTQTYLLMDDPMGARRSYIEVLKANPEFIADPNIHPVDIVYLSKKFTAAPVLGWSVSGGSNLTAVRVIQDNHIFGQRQVREEYKLQPGYQVRVGGDVYLYERFGVKAELGYMFSRFQHTTQNYFQADTKVLNERQTWLNAPVTVMYHEPLGRYRFFGYAGYSVSFLARDVGNITVENIRGTEAGKDEKESPDLNFITKRNRWNQAVVVGGGVKVKLGLQFLFVDVRYTAGLKNNVTPGNLYSDNGISATSPGFVSSGESTFAYAHVDDYFRTDHFSLSFGFLQPLYKARELKRARTKGVSRKINASQK